ncbi:MAG TPA: anhydro-N-acetylmuramic acid kinase [Chitinophagaceae bacterium]|nr:anhydro-N-acetylmuramic acid kinase [Chitinophagaceae bacterium]
MVYKVIGLMSGSSLDGLDIVYTELLEERGKWQFDIIASACYEYEAEWKDKLRTATDLSALDYQLLHTAYGHYLGGCVNRFIQEFGLEYKVALIASHGHTTFHFPQKKMTAQLGDGAAIAAVTGLPVVSDLRAVDVAFGGQGAPIVPIGEKLLLDEYHLFLNIGGIANISCAIGGKHLAFDVCPANRVLNSIALKSGKEFDQGGQMASVGNLNKELLQKLNELWYYALPAPKSLDNSFGADEISSLIRSFGLTDNDSLRTYVEHICYQIKLSIQNNFVLPNEASKLLVTGGGAFNSFLMSRLTEELRTLQIEVVVPESKIVEYKEALIMALIGVLRWRQEYNVLSSVTGAKRDSINGAVWIGQEA